MSFFLSHLLHYFDYIKEIEVVYTGGIGPKGQDRSPFVNVLREKIPPRPFDEEI